MTAEALCEDCPKSIHANEIKELKGDMKNVEKGVFRILLTIVGSVLTICAVILTGIGMANNSYQKASTLNHEIYEQQSKGIQELKKYQKSIDDSADAVGDFRSIVNKIENEWYARKQNEDFIMKQLYKISAKLEKEN